MSSFINFLRAILPISSELAQAITAAVVIENFPAQHLLLRRGPMARRVYILKTGLVRGYTLLHGREVMTWFMQAGNFVISIMSYFTQQPSADYLDLLELAVVLSNTHKQYGHG